MIVKFKKLHPDAIIPEYQTSGSAGFDLHALESVTMHGFTYPELVRTGLAIEVNNDSEFDIEIQIRPRSGLAVKSGLVIVNSPGTIDSDYRGEIMVAMRYIPYLSIYDDFLSMYRKTFTINKGDRIAQAVVTPVFRCNIKEVCEISETKRGEGGFGHTGR